MNLFTVKNFNKNEIFVKQSMLQFFGKLFNYLQHDLEKCNLLCKIITRSNKSNVAYFKSPFTVTTHAKHCTGLM